ncbi:hypothetical protein C1H46_009859 [Malus baccata]|uniref:C2 domain-containing protein n=1 Tax=Malus baccata TaxID=106549 RepID=A0A540N0H9_MALBA|nr:hypothetical protein C1H46_009859 [Malus baccata]
MLRRGGHRSRPPSSIYVASGVRWHPLQLDVGKKGEKWGKRKVVASVLIISSHRNLIGKMPHGTLEVLLVSAKGLDNNDFLGNMDPYVILTVRTQDKKSTVVSGQGSEPEWNETFSFTVSDDVDELRLKIMDKDTFSSDDFIGEATVALEPLFAEGSLPPTPYNVVNQDKEYSGEIKVGLTFTPERSGHGDSSGDYGDSEGYGGERKGSRKGEESYGDRGGDYGGGGGGWKESSKSEDSSGGWKESSAYRG